MKRAARIALKNPAANPQKAGFLGTPGKNGRGLCSQCVFILFGLFFSGLLCFLPLDPASAQPNGPDPITQGEAPAFDPEAPPRTRIRLSPSLTFGGKVEIEYTLERNFDLRKERNDRRSVASPELSTAFSFDPSRNFQAFLNMELSHTLAWEAMEGREGETRLRLRQTFLRWRRLANNRLSVQIGRLRFKDDREWLYDEEIDAARVVYRHADLEVTFSAGRSGLFKKDLLGEGPARRVNETLLYGRYMLGEEGEIVAYGFVRDDRSARESHLIFYGLHADGEVADRLDYWLELAQVRGRNRGKEIRGIGFDLGATYSFDRPWKPSLTVGTAFGSGDEDPEDSLDRRFRQTGLQENEDKWGGVTRFKYYGVLLDPMLSNLSIFTGGVGVRPTRDSSLDLVYHFYLQHHPSTEIFGAEIDAEPTGLRRPLGGEVDLIAGLREKGRYGIELALGFFFPGSAFPPSTDRALLIALEFQVDF